MQSEADWPYNEVELFLRIFHIWGPLDDSGVFSFTYFVQKLSVSMNEVNIKYWFCDFHKKNYGFSAQIMIFIAEKPKEQNLLHCCDFMTTHNVKTTWRHGVST
jgi:hypothetical protein